MDTTGRVSSADEEHRSGRRAANSQATARSADVSDDESSCTSQSLSDEVTPHPPRSWLTPCCECIGHFGGKHSP